MFLVRGAIGDLRGNATKKGISLKPDVYFKIANWTDWSKAVRFGRVALSACPCYL